MMKSVFRVAFNADHRLAMKWREDVPIPVVAKPTHVRVKIVAAGANPADYKLNSGMLPFSWLFVGKPIASDVAGVVDQVGNDVKGLKVGDRVFGCTGVDVSGAFSEFVVADSSKFVPIPDGTSFEEAAAVPLAACTALTTSKLLKDLDKGQTVVVRGASGGVGVFLTQLLVNRGAHVIAISSREDLCRQLGAQEVINYKTTDWSKHLAGRNVDVFIDLIGGDEAWFQSFAVLKPSGRFVTIAGNFGDGLSVSVIAHALGAAIYRFFAYRLSTSPSYEMVFATESKEMMDELAAMMKDKKLRAILDPACPYKFTFDDIVAMMERMKRGDVMGKVVCRVAQTS